MIRILIIEDSSVVAMLLRAIIEAEPDMTVIGHASNGREGVHLANELKPDLITMDIRMPVMDGFEATRMIMSTCPTPIVVVTSSAYKAEQKTTFRAIEEGALAVIDKPHGLSHPDFEEMSSELIDVIRAMSEVPVVKRRLRKATIQKDDINIFEKAINQVEKNYKIITIGCSTGGPQALQLLLSKLPVGLPSPIVIVQHISLGFVDGLVDWLQGTTLLNIKLAKSGELLKNGTVYFAPDDTHLLIEYRNKNGDIYAKLSDLAPENGVRPSIDILFRSVAQSCKEKAIGILLTGMGCDGADGLLAIQNSGGHTIVQDKESSIVWGMPGSAMAMGAAKQVVDLENMPGYILSLVRR